MQNIHCGWLSDLIYHHLTEAVDWSFRYAFSKTMSRSWNFLELLQKCQFFTCCADLRHVPRSALLNCIFLSKATGKSLTYTVTFDLFMNQYYIHFHWYSQCTVYISDLFEDILLLQTLFNFVKLRPNEEENKAFSF